MSSGGFFLGTRGTNLSFLNQDTATSPRGSAREIHPQIDPALITKWLRLCEVHHETTCAPKHSLIKTPENPSGLKVFRVVDTKLQCIVAATPGVRYIALSYVWGQVVPSIRLQTDNIAQLSTEGALLHIRKSFPKTINDAIDLVNLIGERYLWVDSLCLIQDDSGDMLDGISHMDLVYQCAIFTIIAAHGANANTGLPGLHPGSREVNQLIMEVEPGVRMTDTDGVYNALQNGPHTSRGWTMQEFVLSYRTLIFSENCIYFRCRQNCWSEDTIYDNFPLAINEVLHSGFHISFLSDQEAEPFDAFNWQLCRYTGRNLAKQADAIHAFTGILRRFSEQTNSGILQGILTVAFDINFLWWDPSPQGATPERRKEFPSWSWAGWHGVKFGFGAHCGAPAEANFFLKTKAYIVWYKRNPDTEKPELVWDLQSTLKHGELGKDQIGYRPTANNPYGRAINRSLNNLKTRPDEEDIQRERYINQEIIRRNYHFLHFFAFVVFAPAFIADFGEAVWAQVYKIIGSNGSICGGIKFDDPKLVNAVGPYELVLISQLDRFDGEIFRDGISHDRKVHWVVLIMWQDKERVIAERRGIGYLFQDCMKYMLTPGKWTEIVLA
ncbi:heterokaryon incompatibility protein-domain-containing protein [Flammula alnicola]|nr:heterokaryon incompatibility protein-domain-containing protein [Flammula alnicola]